MRPRLFRYSIGVTCVLGSLIAAASSCGRLDNGPEEQLESDSAALEQAAPLTDSTGQVATPVPGSKLDRQQLVALVGKAAPAGVGEACPTIGMICAPPVNGILRACGGFSGICDSTGTEDVLPINFICLPGSSGNVCTAVAGQTPQTIDCTVPTDGQSCSTGCGGSFCAAYSSQCDEETNRVRNCFSNGVCSNNSCVNQTFSQEIVGTCTRETDGQSCTTMTLCQPPKAGICTVNGLCACLLGPQ
jgi:hypothetical protein